MAKVVTNRSKLYASQRFNANFDTMNVQQFDVSEHLVIKLVVQNAGPSNALVVHARIRGRNTWSSIFTVVGDTEEIVNVELFDEIRLQNTVFDTVSYDGYNEYVLSGFENTVTSVTATPGLPPGASTEAKQDAAITILTDIESNFTGLATEAKQDDQITELQEIKEILGSATVAIKSATAIVTDTATKIEILPGTLPNRRAISIRVMGVDEIYFGDSVTATVAGGYPKFEREELTLTVDKNAAVTVWGICKPGKTSEIRILEVA